MEARVMKLLRGSFLPLALMVCAVCLCVTSASAARLNLSHPHYPLVASDFIDVVYNPTGGGGGGKAAIAQAGGKYKDKLDEALQLVRNLI